jgi:hypothetical protein
MNTDLSLTVGLARYGLPVLSDHRITRRLAFAVVSVVAAGLYD